MSIPKFHHYVPRFILRGFSSDRTDGGRVYIFDKIKKISFSSTPASAFGSNHFYRVRSETSVDGDELAIEKHLADAESRASEVLQELKESPKRLAAEQMARIVHLISLQFIRSPTWRHWLEGMYLSLFEKNLIAYSRNKASRRRWHQMMKFDEIGSERMEPDQMLSRLKSGDFTVRSDDDWKMALSFDMLPLVYNMLHSRYWTLAVLPDEMSLAIPDSGLCLVPLSNRPVQAVGLTDPATMIAVPISANQVMLSTVSKIQRPGSVLLEQMINTSAIAMCQRQLLAATPTFRFTTIDGLRTDWTQWQVKGGSLPEMADYRNILSEYSERPADRPCNS